MLFSTPLVSKTRRREESLPADHRDQHHSPCHLPSNRTGQGEKSLSFSIAWPFDTLSFRQPLSLTIVWISFSARTLFKQRRRTTFLIPLRLVPVRSCPSRSPHQTTTSLLRRRLELNLPVRFPNVVIIEPTSAPPLHSSFRTCLPPTAQLAQHNVRQAWRTLLPPWPICAPRHSTTPVGTANP